MKDISNIFALLLQTGNPAKAKSLEVTDKIIFPDATEQRTAADPLKQFWSVFVATVDLTSGGTDVDCPDIVVSGIPAGVTINKVLGMLQYTAIENTNSGGSNGFNGAQNMRVKKSTGTWGADDIVFMPLVDNLWVIPASTIWGGNLWTADDASDCKSEVDGNGTYNVRFENAIVDLDDLRFHGLKIGFIFWYS